MIALNFANYLADSQIGSLSIVKDLQYGHLVSLNARYLSYGSIPRTDEYSNRLGTFSAMDAAVGVGYAYQLEDDWTIGANLNYITSKIDSYTSAAVSGSAGVTYHNKNNKETAALLFKNFGYQFKSYNGYREQMPFRVDFGYTKILEQFPIAYSITVHDLQKWNISADYDMNGQKPNFSRKIMDHLSFGAELFPEQAFNLRAGYNLKRGNELAVADQRSFAGLSFGFGIKISSFRFDYSHVRYHNASNINQFGLSIDLIQLAGNRR